MRLKPARATPRIIFRPIPRLQINRARELALWLGVGLLMLGFCYATQPGYVTTIWPWPDGRLSALFVCAALGATAVPLLWIAASGELAGLAPLAVGGFVGAGGSALYLTILALQGRAGLGGHIVLFTLVGLAGALALTLVRKHTVRAGVRLSRPLLLALWAVALAIFLTGGALGAMAPLVFPWPLNPDSSVLFGCLGMGAAAAFAWALRYPCWRNAITPLLSLLIFSLIMLPPLLALIGRVRPHHEASLALSLVVLVASAVLALYYLFLNPATRLWRRPSPGA